MKKDKECLNQVLLHNWLPGKRKKTGIVFNATNGEKMKKRFVTGLALTLLVVSQNAMAADGDITIGLKAGTLGGGLELTADFSEYLALRGSVNYIKFDFDVTLDGVDYTMEPNFRGGAVMLDYHPFGGAFRLTGGMYFTDNSVDVNGTLNSDLISPQYAYLTDSVQVNGSVDFNAVAPYAGLGWSSGRGESGWGVSCEFGVMFQGSATVTELNAVTGIDYGSYQQEVDDFLDRQKKEIQDELDKYELYPVASVMLNYSF